MQAVKFAFFCNTKDMSFLPLFPFYDKLKLGGHYACAFASAVFSAVFLYLVFLLFLRINMFERASTFALWASGLIWVLPMHIPMSAESREIFVYSSFVVILVAVKLLLARGILQALVLFSAFMAGQALVFITVYQKVF